MHGGLLFWYAETAVHAGGSDSVGVVDLPIQRESTTRLPTMWGQSAKGALRDYARECLRGKIPGWPAVDEVFGSPPPGSPGAGTGPPAPGWLAVGDLRLVAFPVPTLAHTFAWVTSPLLLARVRRAADLVGAAAGLPEAPTVLDGTAIPTSAGHWTSAVGDKIAVGEHVLRAGEADPNLKLWAEWLAVNALPGTTEPGAASDVFTFFRAKLTTDLLLVSDADLTTLTEEHAEVVPRVQLGQQSKTVAAGPWYTEYLPAETLMFCLLRDCTPTAGAAAGGSGTGRLDALGGLLTGDVIVAGGDETLGKGLMWLRWIGRGA